MLILSVDIRDQSELKVVKNCEKFWTIFLQSQIFRGGHWKIVPILSPCLARRRL